MRRVLRFGSAPSVALRCWDYQARLRLRMCPVVVEKVEAVEHADHDLRIGEVFGETLIRNVVEGSAARFSDRVEIPGL